MGLYQRICKQCNITFKGGPRAFYCPDCRYERRLESERKYRAKGRKSDRPIGSIDKCKICGKEYTVNSARQIYCTDCARNQIKFVDRIQGLTYYHAKKENINIKRKYARRAIRKCPICGNDYWAVSGKIACSPDCKKQVLRQRKITPSQ